MQTLDSDSDSLSCMIFQYTIGGISKQLLTTKVIFKSLWFCVYIETGYDSGTYQCWTPHNTDWTDYTVLFDTRDFRLWESLSQ